MAGFEVFPATGDFDPGLGPVRDLRVKDCVSECRFWLDQNADIFWIYKCYRDRLIRVRDMSIWRSGAAADIYMELVRVMASKLSKERVKQQVHPLISS